MCVIIIASANTTVEKDVIERAVTRNPHGWGLSVKGKDGRLRIWRGFGEADAWRAFRRMPTDLERIFHARIATSGNQNIANTHPFDATHEAEGFQRVLFHNGTVGIPEFNPDMCDTWHLAQLIKLVPYATAQKALAPYATKEWSRFVLQSSNPEQETYYFGSGWVTRDGVLYSNGSALATGVTGSGKYREYSGGKLSEVGVSSDTKFPGSTYDNKTRRYVATGVENPPASSTSSWASGLGENYVKQADGSFLYSPSHRSDYTSSPHLRSLQREEDETYADAYIERYTKWQDRKSSLEDLYESGELTDEQAIRMLENSRIVG